MTTRTIRKAGWVHIEARRLLCARSRGKRLYYVPGGKPEGDETMEAALRREIREELGIALASPAVPMGRITVPADGQDGMMVDITLFTAAPLGSPVPGAEIEELRWLSAADAPIASAATAQLLTRLKADDVID
jgi:8-oxo-dGTP diphosphatase